jgi:predicted N-acetyltransferase YhbS
MSEEKNMYYGRGTAEMFDDYMDFINYVFGFNGDSSDFKKLLPKLYKYEYEPAVNSFVALEGDKFRAAVGAFDHDMSVCGTHIKTRGIGNVAVHPYFRGSGYMKKLMNMALDDMIESGVDLSVLGGRRQRYNYFSYDKLGSSISMSFNSDNMRHVFGKDRKHKITFARLKNTDLELIEAIKKLAESKPYYGIRETERYFEILSSWHQKAYVAFLGGEFFGYAVVKGSDVSEFLVKDEAYLREFISSLYDTVGVSTLYVKTPAFLPTYVDSLIGICEGYSLETSKFFSVLNYKKVVSAFMALKATYTDLPDGRIILDIDGKAGREKICIQVSSGEISVDYTDDNPDLVLSHIEAMNLIFAPVSIKRENLGNFAKIWFPLPIYVYSSDAV